MTLRVVIDMNLSPDWVATLAAAGRHSVHWRDIGDPRAPDSIIMAWAKAHDHVVLTHDLDFGTMLALTHAHGPNVIQVRGQDVLPDTLALTVIAALNQHEADLAMGALLVVDLARARVRLLPLRK